MSLAYTCLRGVGVITKLYFAIFAPFKESVTFNLAQRSSKVIDFGTNRKRVHIFLLVVNSNLDLILYRFRDTVAEMSKIDNFPYPTPIPAKIWGVPFGGRSVMLGSAESQMVRLISRKIIFAEFQPIWSRYLKVSPFLHHLRNQWPLISLRGHPRSSILVPIESAYTYSY